MNKLDIQYSVDDLLLKHGISPCILTDKQGEILYIHGDVGNYLGPSAGVASLNVVDMSRPGFDTKLSYAIREINHENSPLIYQNIAATDSPHHFHLIVKLITDIESERELILIRFEEIYSPPVNTVEHKTEAQDERRIIELERELKYIKENLQSAIEELKSTNEELQSTNEELQSTNEELETSKEELVTVNTELENRIEELSNTNDDIKNLLDSTNIATIFLDNDFSIKRYTPKATEIIRLIPSDIGRSIFDIVHNLSGNQFTTLIKSAMSSRKLLEQEVASLDRSFYMRITPYSTTHSNQEGIVLTFEDITEIKRHRDELETIVEKRTDEILRVETELRRYEKRLAKMDRFNSVGEIATSIAHEINQPLANISNYTQGLLERLKEGKIDKTTLEVTLNKLLAAVKRSSNIVKSMRDFLLKKPPNRSSVNVNEIARDVITHLKPTCQKNKIQLKLHLDSKSPNALVDSTQLEQVLINLLNNAIESVTGLPGSQRKIRLRTEHDDAFIHISIEDNGPEIPLGIIKQMFNLFFTTKPEGLGIGLAICRTIVESHNGDIHYISDADRHNIFKITLPLEVNHQ